MAEMILAIAYLLNGFILGVITTIAVIGYFGFSLIKELRLSSTKTAAVDEGVKHSEEPSRTESKSGPRHHNWPENLTNFLKEAIYSDTHDGADEPNQLLWLNAFIHRYFVECRTSPVLKAKIKQKLIEKLQAKFRGDTQGILLQSIEVTAVNLGDNAPLINDIKLVKRNALFSAATDDLDVILELDINYDGGLAVSILTTLNLGVSIPVSACLKGFKNAKMHLRLPSPSSEKEFALAFVNDPGVDIEVEASLLRNDYEMLKDVLNSFLVRRLKSMFCDMFVLPHYKSYEMPLITYKPVNVNLMKAIELEKSLLASTEKKHASMEDLTGEESGAVHNLSSARPAAGAKFRNLVSSVLPAINTNVTVARGTLSAASTAETASPLPTSETPLNASFSLLNRKRSNSVVFIPDVMESKCFPVSSVVTSENVDEFGKSLVSSFYRASSNKQDSSFSEDAWSFSNWETVRNRKDILVQKKTFTFKAAKGDIFRGSYKINKCTASMAYQILCNPEHLRHVDDCFAESHVLERFDDTKCVRKYVYKFGRTEKQFTVLEINKKLNTSHEGTPESFVICYRSLRRSRPTSSSPKPLITEPNEIDKHNSPRTVPSSEDLKSEASTLDMQVHDFVAINPKAAPLTLVQNENVSGQLAGPNVGLSASTDNSNIVSRQDSKGSVFSSSTVIGGSSSRPLSQTVSIQPHGGILESSGTVFIYGYLIESNPNDSSSCNVTVLSQYGSAGLQRLEVNWNRCMKTKMFIEELAEWTLALGELKESSLVSKSRTANTQSYGDIADSNDTKILDGEEYATHDDEEDEIGTTRSRRGSDVLEKWKGFYKKGGNTMKRRFTQKKP
jgi:hypothetical protein